MPWITPPQDCNRCTTAKPAREYTVDGNFERLCDDCAREVSTVSDVFPPPPEDLSVCEICGGISCVCP